MEDDHIYLHTIRGHSIQNLKKMIIRVASSDRPKESKFGRNPPPTNKYLLFGFLEFCCNCFVVLLGVDEVLDIVVFADHRRTKERDISSFVFKGHPQIV